MTFPDRPVDHRPAPTWDDTLAALEAELAASDTHLGGTPQAWKPPEELGQLPVHLEQRARDLRAALDASRASVEVALDAVKTELASIDRRRDAGHAYQSNDVPRQPSG